MSNNLDISSLPEETQNALKKLVNTQIKDINIINEYNSDRTNKFYNSAGICFDCELSKEIGLGILLEYYYGDFFNKNCFFKVMILGITISLHLAWMYSRALLSLLLKYLE